MGFLSADDDGVRYGAIIDVGSGSVLTAILKSDSSKTHPEIIWAKREYAPLRKVDSLNDSAKYVMTSLVNALMLLNSEGRKALNEQTKKTKLPVTQITIAAPWSYTITKNISYSHAEPFVISEDLIEELLRTAHQKVKEDLIEHERVNQLGLSIIARSIIGLEANGYILRSANNQKAKSMRVVEASAIAQNYLTNALKDACEKVLPESKIELFSFILVYYYILRAIYPETQEFCIVDITYEATELGIVRDGALNYTTHTPFGSFSLARELAEILSVPLEEAFGYLHDTDPQQLIASHAPGKLEEVEELFASYRDRLTKLFHETGDRLAIPKKIFLHGNLATENFFREQIAAAAKNATNSSHAVYPVSKEILTRHYGEEEQNKLMRDGGDTALLISAQFFHMPEYRHRFEHP